MKQKVYEKSQSNAGGRALCMARADGVDYIIADEALGFAGAAQDGKTRASLTHENACLLRKVLPHTAPSPVLREKCSFGVGDRLGIAGGGHCKVAEEYDALPVLAQQSVRELTLTNRTFENVLDAATFAVFRSGFKKPWGADGDHLKKTEDVGAALKLGYTMITLDCSEYIKKAADSGGAALPNALKDKYVGKQFDIGEGQSITFDEPSLKDAFFIYGGAIEFASEIWQAHFAGGKYNADFEISIDETEEATIPSHHYFIARELKERGVKFATLAPRFTGEFQKGIDYIGDIAQFEKELKVHAQIARAFGYKLSIHSGSDKFSVFPIIGRETRGNFHIKTAGTNWLEAMRVIALRAPAVYRKIHKAALGFFVEASKYYHVSANIAKIPDTDRMTDEELPSLFENNAARQLIHITYGQILQAKTQGGAFLFRDELYKLWSEYDYVYTASLVRHIGRHLELLGVPKA